jgi:hypothetical protein
VWFGKDAIERKDCCDPAGSHNNSQGVKVNGVSVLKAHGFQSEVGRWQQPPVDRARVMERIAGQMRKRTPMGEAYGINNDPRCGCASPAMADRRATWHFLVDGDEAGYVWDEHLVSEGSKQYPQGEERRLVRARPEREGIPGAELREAKKDRLCVAGRPWEALDPKGKKQRTRRGETAGASRSTSSGST